MLNESYENYPKAERIEKELLHEIASGNFGTPGTPFMTTRALMSYKSISLKTAHRILGKLCAGNSLEVRGKRYYLKAAATPAVKPLIGLLVTRLDTPFFSNLASNIEELVRNYGAELSILVSNYDVDLERRQLERFVQSQAAGILATPWGVEDNAEIYEQLPSPCVLIGRKLPNAAIDTVLVDSFKAARQVAAHLIKCQCREFAYVGLKKIMDDQRLEGFKLGLLEHGIKLKENHILRCGDSADAPGEIAKLLNRRQEKLGVFCYHDLIAANVITGCHEAKIRMPDEVSVVGFDNLPVAAAIYPSLTSVSYPVRDMARIACEVLFAKINSRLQAPGIDRYLDSQLIIRNSTER